MVTDNLVTVNLVNLVTLTDGISNNRIPNFPGTGYGVYGSLGCWCDSNHCPDIVTAAISG